MLCNKCDNIHFKRLEDCDHCIQDPGRFQLKQNEERAFSVVGDSSFYFHHDSVDALSVSAGRGCHLCCMILAAIKEDEGSWSSDIFLKCSEVVSYNADLLADLPSSVFIHVWVNGRNYSLITENKKDETQDGECCSEAVPGGGSIS